MKEENIVKVNDDLENNIANLNENEAQGEPKLVSNDKEIKIYLVP